MKNQIKKNTRYFLVALCLFLVAGLIAFCSNSPVASGDHGSGTGVGNGAVVIGKLLGSDSLPVANALVRLRTDQYLADTSGKGLYVRNNDTMSTVHTNDSGLFIIDSLRYAKSYVVEVIGSDKNHSDSGTLYKFTVPGDTADTIKLPERVVEPVKTLKGAIVINGLPQNAYIQIYGMEHIGRTDSTGRFTIDHLPVGECERNECEYKIRILVVNSDKTITVHNSELEITFDMNQNVIDVELELDEGDENDDGD